MNVKSAVLSTATVATIFFGAVTAMELPQSVSDWPWDRSENSAASDSGLPFLTDAENSSTNDWPWD